MNKNNFQEIIVNENDIRIDKYLTMYLDISRSQIKQYFDHQAIFLNNHHITKLGQKVYVNDVILIDSSFKQANNEVQLKPFKYELNILYQDEYFLVIYKPSGMLSHPTSYGEEDTLLNALKYKLQTFNKFFLVHRLDRDTAGLLIVAKSEKIQEDFQQMFINHLLIKKYYAIVHHWFNEKHLIINLPIARSLQKKLYFQTSKGKNAKQAKTEIFLVQNLKNQMALVDIILHTGRTHQIRVHLRAINHPILNDKLYGIDHLNNKYGQFLMNYYLKFNHPVTNEVIELKIDFDEEFKYELQRLGYE